MSYDRTIETKNGNTDFLGYVLFTQRAGYSVHYASIAACLLRYYGVPARYVEGYLLPEEQAEAAAPGETVLLTEENAHAWAEFYLDGVGWIPFEVTPGYDGLEEETLQGLLEDPNSPLHQNLNQVYAVQRYQPPQAFVQSPQEEEPAKNDREPFRGWIFLALLPFLCVFLWFLRSACLRIRLSCRLKELRQKEPKEAVAGLFAYCSTLRAASGLLESCGLDWETQAFLNREALFSRHAMTQAQKDSAVAFLAAVRACCQKTLPWRRRFYLKWIRCIL